MSFDLAGCPHTKSSWDYCIQWHQVVSRLLGAAAMTCLFLLEGADAPNSLQFLDLQSSNLHQGTGILNGQTLHTCPLPLSPLSSWALRV